MISVYYNVYYGDYACILMCVFCLCVCKALLYPSMNWWNGEEMYSQVNHQQVIMRYADGVH